jgi:hypothetical protein
MKIFLKMKMHSVVYCRHKGTAPVRMALPVLAILLVASSVGPQARGAGTCWLQQSFPSYQENHVYSASDAKKDFPSTVGPFKMVEGGDKGGSSSTKITEGAIRGFFPKGATPYPDRWPQRMGIF